jgi:hypothetical protein
MVALFRAAHISTKKVSRVGIYELSRFGSKNGLTNELVV